MGGAIADGAFQPPSRNPGPQSMPTLPNPLDSDGPVPSIRTRGSVPAAPGRAVPEQPNLPFPSTVTAGQDADVMAMAYAGSPLETDTVRTVYGVASALGLTIVVLLMAFTAIYLGVLTKDNKS